MSRRDAWKEVSESMRMRSGQMGKNIDEREKMPEKACGVCQNFSENAYESDGRGSCRILKMGSNIKVSPTVLVTNGDVGLIAYINTDGGNCPHFLKMEIIDHDLGEISDPRYRRVHRIMEKK